MTPNKPRTPEEQNEAIKDLIDSAVKAVNQEDLAPYNKENPDNSLRNLTAERLSTTSSLVKNDPVEGYLVNEYTELWTFRGDIKEFIKELEDGNLTAKDANPKIVALISEMIVKLGESKDSFKRELSESLTSWLSTYKDSEVPVVDSLKELIQIIRTKHKDLYMSGYPDMRINEEIYEEDDNSDKTLGIDLNKSVSGDTVVIYLDNNEEKIPVGVANILVYKAESFAERKVIKKSEDGISIDGSDVLFETSPKYVINIGWVTIRPDYRSSKKGIRLLNPLMDVVKASIKGIKDTVGEEEVLVVMEQDGMELVHPTRIQNLSTLDKPEYKRDDYEIYTVEKIDEVPDDLNIVKQKSFNEGDLLCVIQYINEDGHYIPAYETKTDKDGKVVEILRYISPINRLNWEASETAGAVNKLAKSLELTEVNGVYHLVDFSLNPGRIFTSSKKDFSKLEA